MKVYSQERFGVDVLKVEVPVNMKYVRKVSLKEKFCIAEEKLLLFYKEQANNTLPFIFLSAGVSAQLFQKHFDLLRFRLDIQVSFVDVLLGPALPLSRRWRSNYYKMA